MMFISAIFLFDNVRFDVGFDDLFSSDEVHNYELARVLFAKIVLAKFSRLKSYSIRLMMTNHIIQKEKERIKI